MPVRVSPAPYHAVTPDDDAGETLIRDGREAVLAQLAAGGCPALKHVARLAVVGSEQLQQKGWRRVGMCKGGGGGITVARGCSARRPVNLHVMHAGVAASA